MLIIYLLITLLVSVLSDNGFNEIFNIYCIKNSTDPICDTRSYIESIINPNALYKKNYILYTACRRISQNKNPTQLCYESHVFHRFEGIIQIIFFIIGFVLIIFFYVVTYYYRYPPQRDDIYYDD
jgi:hypothetical protein